MAIRVPLPESAVTSGEPWPRSLSSMTRGVLTEQASGMASATHFCGAITIRPAAPSAVSRSTARTTVDRSAVVRAIELTR